ncbi:hypothetical protein GCM10009557_21660 [Virgisporangium ochraceum]
MTNTAVTSNNTLRKLAGAAFFAAPVLMVGGMLTSPPQNSNSARDYLASLARDWDLSILSANLFHYAWVLLAVAVPAALALLRGARGRTPASVGVVGTAVGAVQMSGLLFSDWTSAAMPTIVSLDEAVLVFDKVNADPSMAAWLLSAKVLAILMPVVLMAGLARNGTVGWWTAPMALTPMIVGPMVGGLAGCVVSLALYAPLFLVGYRLVRRASADVIAAEAAGPLAARSA